MPTSDATPAQEHRHVPHARPGTAEEQPTAASRPGKESLEAEPAVLRQPQLLQHQVVLADLVVVIDARAPSKELRDHVWTRPTPSTVERRTMRLPASLSFRCKPAVAQHSCACRSTALSHPQGAGGGHTQLRIGDEVRWHGVLTGLGVGHWGTTDSRRRRERRHDTMDTSGANRS
eukprot:jgi/Tetstr1/420733/TSEL_001069.t1